MDWSFSLAPLLDLRLLAGLAVAAALVAGLGLWSRRRGAVLRTAALAALLVALAGPELRRESRETLPAVAVLLVDRSASQRLPGREAITEAARSALAARIAALPGIELREAVFDDRTDPEADGTRLFDTLSRTLADVAPDRVAGVVAITDGQVHDVPDSAARLGFEAPVHVLLTGRADEIDRRITTLAAPRFGIVSKTQKLTFRVDDEGLPGPRPPVAVHLRRDGVEIAARPVVPGTPVTFDVDLPHAGDIVFEAEVDPLAGDLTRLDDRAVVTVRGIRENLRVLLVSGAPYPGERTWRNLLKSDASVDLVHFTILRPPEKQDPVPVSELSLIAFPTRELFQDRLGDFDLVVFDGYRRRGLLTDRYFENIAARVRDGGALLVAAGAELADPGGLAETPLAAILPATPLDGLVETPFRPHPTGLGARHPVTRDLPGADAAGSGAGAAPAWGRWLRQAPVVAGADATTVLAGADDAPLLLLARRGKGRVGLLASDQVWLWARGFDGGGPHTALLRRLAHWLMQEPELEEEALRLSRDGRTLVVERQTLADRAAPVTLTDPLGATRSLDLAPAGPGLWRAAVAVDTQGLWRASDGTLTALAAFGPADPLEFSDLRSTDARLAPLAAATGGSIRRLLPGRDDRPAVPAVEVRDGGRGTAGSDQIVLSASRAAISRGAERVPLAAGFAAAALLFALFAAAWWREGR